MAFIFAGNGIKELQAAGWVPTTPLNFPPQVPLLGIYPTMETLACPRNNALRIHYHFLLDGA